MSGYEIAIIAIATVGLGLNILTAVVGMTWGIGKVRDTVRSEMEEEISSLRSAIGETFTAIRTKIQEVELYVRDNFVRRDSFAQGMSNFSDEMRGNFAKMDARLERMENKIDSKT